MKLYLLCEMVFFARMVWIWVAFRSSWSVCLITSKFFFSSSTFANFLQLSLNRRFASLALVKNWIIQKLLLIEWGGVLPKIVCRLRRCFQSWWWASVIWLTYDFRHGFPPLDISLYTSSPTWSVKRDSFSLFSRSCSPKSRIHFLACSCSGLKIGS